LLTAHKTLWIRYKYKKGKSTEIIIIKAYQAERRCKIEVRGRNYIQLPPGLAQPSNAAVWKGRVFNIIPFYAFIR
jgi:hypothetical protein